MQGVVILILCVALAAVYANGTPQITAQLTISSESDAEILLTIHNGYPQMVALLSWNLPLDLRFSGHSFRVTNRHGRVLPYIGARVKRGEPLLTDYTFFTPNETKTFTVQIKDLYDLARSGHCTVQFIASAFDHAIGSDINSLPRTKNSFVYSPQISSNILSFHATNTKRNVSIVAADDCTSSELSTINTAYNNFVKMADAAVRVAQQVNTADYVTWFGTYDITRSTTVRNNLITITRNTIVNYKCERNEPNVYAYVYPSDRQHHIYFCGAFWPIKSIGGYDTKAGTILHELSHFDDLAGTDDWSYGVTPCKNLARTNPARAIANADNYEYFGETQFP